MFVLLTSFAHSLTLLERNPVVQDFEHADVIISFVDDRENLEDAGSNTLEKMLNEGKHLQMG